MQNVADNSITCEDLRHGSDLLFEQIYEQNRAQFINFAKRYNMRQEDVIDVYQDTYIIFYNNVMSGKLHTLTSSVSTYLFSIGKHLIFDRLRKEQKKVSHKFDVERVGAQDAIMTAIEIDDDEGVTEEQKLLSKYFGTLGKQCQRLLTLFYYRGYTIKDIMKKENYNSENVVKSQKSRCMKTLKDKIKADQSEP